MTNVAQSKQSCPMCSTKAINLPYMSGRAFDCPSCGASLRVRRSKGVALAGFIILFSLTRIAGDVPFGWGIFALAAIAILAWENSSRTLVLATRS